MIGQGEVIELPENVQSDYERLVEDATEPWPWTRAVESGIWERIPQRAEKEEE